MRNSHIANRRRRSEAGFTLIMVVFLVASMILFAAMAVPVILTEGRREMEKETIWRGEQYERAIGLYYRKFGHYPTKVEDLTRQTNGIRFLRQAYTDPMNKEDGSWRFIYVGPNGQLIGSVRQTSLLQNALFKSSMTGGASPFGAGLQPLQAPGGAIVPGSAAPGPGQFGQPQPLNSLANPSSSEPQPQPLGGAVIGGNIIGVGSKNKMSSFRVYLGGDTYEKWEFIWNPMLQGQQIPPQNTAPSQPGAPGVPLPVPQTPQIQPGSNQPPPGQQ